MSPTALAAREEVLAVLAGALPQLRALGVSDVRLFGSVARGDSRPESDVDVLVHFGDTPSFSQYLAVSDLLTTVLQGLKLLELDSVGGSGSRGYGKVKFVNLNIDGKDAQARLDAIKPFER